MEEIMITARCFIASLLYIQLAIGDSSFIFI